MKMKKIGLWALSLCMMIWGLAGCTAPTEAVIESQEPSTFSDRDLSGAYDEANAVRIVLSDKGSQASVSKGVEILNHQVKISQEGTYIFEGTLSKGQILVEAPKTDKIQIVLSGITINNENGAGIYVKQADKVFITLDEASENRVSTVGEFVMVDDNKVDASIFSKEDLTFNGKGTLIVESEKGHGIVSKDDLVLTSGSYNISALEGHGLSGKDAVLIANGSYEIQASKDGIHSDGRVEINDGKINILKSNEGIEGKEVVINGGEHQILSSDDGLNARSESEGGDPFKVDESAFIEISGGTLRIDAGGDGVDSNGHFYVKGGNLYILGPERGANGAIDYNGVGEISGGSVFAVGTSKMAQSFSEGSKQASIYLQTTSVQSGDILLKNELGEVLESFSTKKAYSSLVISSPKLELGKSYSLQMGNETQTVKLDTLIYGNVKSFPKEGRMMPSSGQGEGGRRGEKKPPLVQGNGD